MDYAETKKGHVEGNFKLNWVSFIILSESSPGCGSGFMGFDMLWL